MFCDAAVISSTDIDFTKLIAATSRVVGHTVSAASDASARKISKYEKFVSCLNALKNKDAPVGLEAVYLSHLHFGVLFVCDSRTVEDSIPHLAGMAITTVPTVATGVICAVASGDLRAWKSSVITGTQDDKCRVLFCSIMTALESVGVGSIWSAKTKRPVGDVFQLEDKR